MSDTVQPLPISGTFGASVYPISTSLTPSWTIGTVGYYQVGIFGAGKGLLLSLTNTPIFIKVLMTSNGLQKVN